RPSTWARLGRPALSRGRRVVVLMLPQRRGLMTITRLVRVVSLTLSLAVTLALAADPARAQDLQGTLKKIKDSGTITLGYREQSVPFAFKGDDGKPVGVIPGTTTEAALRGALQKALVTAQIMPVKDHREGLTGVENGTLDAYASDRVILIGLAVTAKDPSLFAIADTYLSYEPYGLMLRRGDAAFRLSVNRALSQLYRSGEIMQIYGRWFGKLGKPGNLLLAMYALNAIPE